MAARGRSDEEVPAGRALIAAGDAALTVVPSTRALGGGNGRTEDPRIQRWVSRTALGVTEVGIPDIIFY